MTDRYSTETAGEALLPIVIADTPAYGGRVRRKRASIVLASQAIGDNIYLGRLPNGSAFCYGIITTDTSLSTAVVGVGSSKTAGSGTILRTGAVLTATDTPAFFGKTAAIASGNELTSDLPVYLTIATAALPSSGNLVVDLYYSAP